MRSILFFYLLALLTGSPLVALLIIAGVYLAADIRFLGLSRRLVDRYQTERAIALLRREVEQSPENAAARNDLGRLLVIRGRFSAALPHLRKAYERMADSDETNYYLGWALLYSGKEKEGEEKIRKALAKSPRFRYGEPHLLLARFYLGAGHYEEARKELDALFLIHSSSTEGYYRLGLLERRAGNSAAAKEAFSRSIEVVRLSPSYKRRAERIWSIKARFARLQLR